MALTVNFNIDCSGDDGAGLSISEGLRSQIRGLNQAGIAILSQANSSSKTALQLLQ
jgi:flagellin-like hook-associated protein FlgL